ncbi:MAG TPA: nucleotide exchange factor GrpE [Cyclobacteriaceae bacterium]|nr:nucleotide exchange factor GrpE [Cyclobacteriaceae bacterium]
MNQGEEIRNQKEQEELVSENQQEMSKQEDSAELDPQVEDTGNTVDERESTENGELSEMKDKYLRLYSEFENFRRRTSREKSELIQSANEQLVQTLLPVLDDFERAEKAVAGNENEVTEGFVLIQNKLKKVLDQFGLKPMAIGPGSDFDADTQEAITQVPAPEEKLKGKVVDVVEKGYMLNDKVIRYAKVVVGN